jgi:FAD/FMN-containing dehydrogenase
LKRRACFEFAVVLTRPSQLRAPSSSKISPCLDPEFPKCSLKSKGSPAAIAFAYPHAGDGNLHPTFVFDGDDVPAEVWTAADDMFEAATRYGGTLTGEHGVGVLKRRWLKDELGEDSYRLQQAIKAVCDPNNIMNPGKVFG